MKYIKLFEEYSGNPFEITIRVTPQFVKEFELELNPRLEGIDKFFNLSVSALPGKSGVTLTRGVMKFIGLGRNDVFWFAKYNPVIGEVFLEGVNVGPKKINSLADRLGRNPEHPVDYIKFDNVFFRENDMKTYRSLNCDFRGKFEEGSVDNDGYVELVSFK